MVDSSRHGHSVLARNTMNPMKKEWFRQLADGRFQCVVCPHGCTLRQGESGQCKVRVAGSNGISNPAASRLTAVAFDPIGKKPLFHFYPGSQVLSLGASGCNLHCAWCQNYAISQVATVTRAASEVYRADELIRFSAENPQSIGVAFTYNEPVIALEWVLETAQKFKTSAQKTVLVTNGFVNPEPLAALVEVIDAFNVDLKGFSEKFYTQFTGGALKPVLSGLKQINEAQKHLEITFLAVTGLNTHLTEFDDMCRWIADNLGPSIPLHISRYHEAWRCSQPATPLVLMKELLQTAKQHLHYVYLGNIARKDTMSTFCHSCGHLLIERQWGRAEVTGMSQNLCSHCHSLVYGRFGDE